MGFLTDLTADFVVFAVPLAARLVVCVVALAADFAVPVVAFAVDFTVPAVALAVDFATRLDFATAFCVADAGAAPPVCTRDECFVRCRTAFLAAASAGVASATAAINAASSNENDFALITELRSRV